MPSVTSCLDLNVGCSLPLVTALAAAINSRVITDKAITPRDAEGGFAERFSSEAIKQIKGPFLRASNPLPPPSFVLCNLATRACHLPVGGWIAEGLPRDETISRGFWKRDAISASALLREEKCRWRIVVGRRPGERGEKGCRCYALFSSFFLFDLWL